MSTHQPISGPNPEKNSPHGNLFFLFKHNPCQRQNPLLFDLYYCTTCCFIKYIIVMTGFPPAPADYPEKMSVVIFLTMRNELA